jgi:hypothetical protein
MVPHGHGIGNVPVRQPEFAAHLGRDDAIPDLNGIPATGRSYDGTLEMIVGRGIGCRFSRHKVDMQCGGAFETCRDIPRLLENVEGDAPLTGAQRAASARLNLV